MNKMLEEEKKPFEESFFSNGMFSFFFQCKYF